MNIAYLISAHTDAPQLKRLIDALHGDAHYFIHIDKKSDITQFTSIISGSQVHFISDRIDVRWGTMLEVEYQMNLIRAAVNCSVQFDRIFFLSGMDYPVWSNQKITSYLQTLGNKEILQGICMNSSAIDEKQCELYQVARPLVNISFLDNKWNTWLSILSRKLLKIVGHRKMLYYIDNDADPHIVQLYKGSAWWCITEDLARYLLHEYENNKKLLNYFSDSFGQAETLIQTIAFNSRQFADRCMLFSGEYPGLFKLTPLHFIDYNPVIQIMTEKDYQRIQQSGKMFVRKVVSGKSDQLVEMLNKDRANGQ